MALLEVKNRFWARLSISRKKISIFMFNGANFGGSSKLVHDHHEVEMKKNLSLKPTIFFVLDLGHAEFVACPI